VTNGCTNLTFGATLRDALLGVLGKDGVAHATPMRSPDGTAAAPVPSPAPFAIDPEVVAQLQSMGFPPNACKRAAIAAKNNAEEAVTWYFAHVEDADINDDVGQNDEPEPEADAVLIQGGAPALHSSAERSMVEPEPEPELKAAAGAAADPVPKASPSFEEGVPPFCSSAGVVSDRLVVFSVGGHRHEFDGSSSMDIREALGARP
jgi:hypothetical protein